MRRLAWLLALAPAARAETYSYWVQPCEARLARASGCEESDPELAQWALEAWQRESGGKVGFARGGDEAKARIRIYWAAGNPRLYGEARPILVEGRRGAEVYVRPDLSSLGPEIDAAGKKDRLFRQAIVYLTCVHESGHAIGLPHTGAFDDIMYSFVYGGDIVEYFRRYRRKLESREDIRKYSGVSAADRRRVAGIDSAANGRE